MLHTSLYILNASTGLMIQITSGRPALLQNGYKQQRINYLCIELSNNCIQIRNKASIALTTVNAVLNFLYVIHFIRHKITVEADRSMHFHPFEYTFQSTCITGHKGT